MQLNETHKGAIKRTPTSAQAFISEVRHDSLHDSKLWALGRSEEAVLTLVPSLLLLLLLLRRFKLFWLQRSRTGAAFQPQLPQVDSKRGRRIAISVTDSASLSR